MGKKEWRLPDWTASETLVNDKMFGKSWVPAEACCPKSEQQEHGTNEHTDYTDHREQTTAAAAAAGRTVMHTSAHVGPMMASPKSGSSAMSSGTARSSVMSSGPTVAAVMSSRSRHGTFLQTCFLLWYWQSINKLCPIRGKNVNLKKAAAIAPEIYSVSAKDSC